MEFRLQGVPGLRPLDDEARDILFRAAHTVYAFDGEPVPDETLRSVWELAQWGPTSANSQPLRVFYVRTPESRERLAGLVHKGNAAKVRSAGATALLAADLRFHEHMPTVMPLRPDYREIWEDDVPTRMSIARLSAALQAGYFIMALRAHGLAAGPFTGFDVATIDEEFLQGTHCSVFMAVNIGYPAEAAALPRLPRLPHDTVVTWL